MLYYYETKPYDYFNNPLLFGDYFLKYSKYKKYLCYYKTKTIRHPVSFGIILDNNDKELIRLKLVENNKYFMVNFYRITLFNQIDNINNYHLIEKTSEFNNYHNFCGCIVMDSYSIEESPEFKGLLVPRMVEEFDIDGMKIKIKN